MFTYFSDQSTDRFIGSIVACTLDRAKRNVAWNLTWRFMWGYTLALGVTLLDSCFTFRSRIVFSC